MKKLRRPVLMAAVAAAFVAGGVTACSSSGSARTASASPTAAAHSTLYMVKVNGHDLAFHVTPGHKPVIVLDAGGGMDSTEWKKVAPALAARTGSEVVTYDRAGEGASADVPGPWRAANAASDLAAGLAKLGVTHDVVLVSHSLAGEIAFSFAKSHPAELAGEVLVDANLPQFFTPSETARLVAMNQQQVAALKKKPATRQTRQLLAEASGYGPVHHAYHKMTWPRNIPATVIVSATTPFPTAHDAALWRKAQHAFADAAPNRDLVVAAHSSHDVPIDRPDVVVTAVQQMVRKVG